MRIAVMADKDHKAQGIGGHGVTRVRVTGSSGHGQVTGSPISLPSSIVQTISSQFPTIKPKAHSGLAFCLFPSAKKKAKPDPILLFQLLYDLVSRFLKNMF